MAIWVTPKLSSLPDVGITGAADGEVLTYDNVTGKWVNEALPASVTDHGALTGLADDDHTGYLLATGSRTGASAAAQAFTNGIIGPSWKPASDSTTALQLQNAAGTSVVNINTSNTYVNIGTAGVSALLSVYGTATTTAGDYTLDVYRTYRHTSGSATVCQFRSEYYPVSAVTSPKMTGASFVLTKLGNETVSSVSSYLVGGRFDVRNASATDVTTYLCIGGDFGVTNSSSTASPTLSNGIAGRFVITANDPITNAYGVQITTPAGGAVVNSYGLYIQAHNVASTLNYAIYTEAGAVRFGDALTVIQDDASGAKPVVTLQQDDVSEEIFEITSTAGEGNAIEAIGAKTLTTTEFIKVTINGNTRYIPAGTIA